MNGNRTLAIVSYITWIGWLVALLAREKDDELVRKHLNQALVLNLISTVCTILSRLGTVLSIIAGVIALICFVFWVMGVVRAVQRSVEPLPFIGEINLIN